MHYFQHVHAIAQPNSRSHMESLLLSSPTNPLFFIWKGKNLYKFLYIEIVHQALGTRGYIQESKQCPSALKDR